MRFNWHRYPSYLGNEIFKFLGGEYTSWNTLLKQIKVTRVISIIVIYLIILLSILSNQLRSYTLNELTSNSKTIFEQITWSHIFLNNYLNISFSDGLNRDKLFLISIYLIVVKSAISIIIFLIAIYIFKFRQARSLFIRRRMPRVDIKIRSQIPLVSVLIAISPFPLYSYNKIKSWNLPNRSQIFDTLKVLNIFPEKQKFPKLSKIKKSYPLIQIKKLSFMYHGDNEWDRWFHEFLKKFFPQQYKKHIIKTNTISKTQESEKTNPITIQNVSLIINSGKFTTILGCNGSSKSTLVKLIIKLFEKYSGDIIWNKANLKNISSKSFYKNVAYISQENIIHNEISVYDYVACGLFPSFEFFKFHYSPNDPIILENLRKMDLLKHKDKNLNKLSGGEKQKAILARVLTQKTPVIILDEPTTYLDINNQYKILNLLKKLQIEEGKTIIAILHDIQQAKQFSDDVILIDNGQIFDYGNANKVLNSKNIEKVFGIKNL